MVTDKLFTELLRPKTFQRMVLLPRIREELEKGLTQNILLYSSCPGSGKTTATRILIEGHDTLVINASAERGIDVIRNQIMNFAGTYSIDGDTSKVKVIQLEEMDGLTADSFDALRAVIERFSGTVRFIGNCNNINKIPEPIQSRFNCIPFYPVNKEENDQLFGMYCDYVKAILGSSKINIECDDESVAAFVKVYFPNMRSIINTVQSMCVKGVTKLDTAGITKTFSCGDLFERAAAPNQDPVETYKLVMGSYSSDVDSAMQAFASGFVDYIMTSHPELSGAIPMVIVTIAEYMAQLTTSIDKTIVLMAMVYKVNMILNQK